MTGGVIMTWQEMRIRGIGSGNSLPGERGRYLLWLESPMVEGEARYVHFSWKDVSFCIRDYMRHRERRQAPGFTPQSVWDAATDHIPCKGELYVPVENFEFWTAKLTEMTEKRRQGLNPSVWSRLSTKFAPKPQEAETLLTDENREDRGGIYQDFIALWKKREGFDVVDGSVGCSARYFGEPLLWVYPTYFQVAPQGKGNSHHDDLLELRARYFPESGWKGSLSFSSEHFRWDRFQLFVNAVQDMIQKARA
jgi:hypothetical protein